MVVEYIVVRMDWAIAALLLLIVGCTTGSIAILVAFWNFIMGTFEFLDTGQNLVVLLSGFISIVTLSSTYIIIRKKL